MSNRDLIELIVLGIIALFVAVYFIIKAVKNSELSIEEIEYVKESCY